MASATQWNVAIFSSVNAGASSLIGDIANVVVATNNVSLTSGFNSNGDTLVNIPININLSNAGTYWLGIFPTLDFSSFGQAHVSNSTLADTTPDNQFMVNPGRGFGFGNSQQTLNASYRLLGEVESVPEPLTILGTAMALGFGTIFKKKVSKVEVSLEDS